MKHFSSFFSKCKKKRSYLKSLALGLTFLFAGYNSTYAQVSAYSFAQSAGSYSPITSGTVLGVATGNASTNSLNSNIYPLTLPFNFVFNGVPYGSLNVSTNGFVT